MSPRPRLTDSQTSEHSRRLVQAAFTVIAATGNADPPVRPILVEAGLSRQVLYRCFGSKEELMDAVHAEGRQILADYLSTRLARVATPEAQVRAWVTGVMRQAQVAGAAERTRPFVASLARRDRGEARAEDADIDRLLTNPLAKAIASGVKAGAWNTDDPVGDAGMIKDFVFASLTRHLLLGITPSRATTQALTGFALRALRGGDSPEPGQPWAGMASRTRPEG
jgi:AcrR family transcriptional regulator